MVLPFDTQQFFDVFQRYNAAIWPAQAAAYLLGLVAVAALFRRRLADRLVPSVLALCWAWNGVAYHIAFFAPVNPAAFVFGALFVVEAVLFALVALRGGLHFRVGADLPSALGLACIVYAMVLYEALGIVAGHGLMQGPLFGVAPCPTTIFTLGMLMLARGRLAAWLAIVPVAWAAIGTTAAVLLGVPEDLGLAVAAVACMFVLAVGRRQARAGH